jgi:hypothetical protein
MAQQLRDPGRIFGVRFPSRHRFDVLGIHHQKLALAFEQIVDWAPVGSAAGEVPKIGPFPSAFPQTGRDVG